jgi:hypothetical protein
MPSFNCPRCGARASYNLTNSGGYSVPQDTVEIVSKCIERQERKAGRQISDDDSCMTLVKEAQRLKSGI